MNYRQSIEYLLSFADFERGGPFQERPDLAPVLSLLRRLGDPHLGRPTVHIAGSKGKGTVAAMVESILRAGGLSTGLFTSPHLREYTERVRIDGEPLPEADWARLTVAVRQAVDALPPDLDERRLVTFDLLTTLGFQAFRERNLDCQVIECGLGGRVDSTNVFDEKDVCAVTAISLEHTNILGDTLDLIAAEKAGIIRPGAVVVLGPQRSAAARAVVRRAAERSSCPVMDVAQQYSWRRLSHDLDGQSFRLRGPAGDVDLWLPVLGEHQIENAATAVACVRALPAGRQGLSHRDVIISDEAIRLGLARLSWPGRMQVLRRQPLVVADGAHSPEAASRLRDTLTDYLSCRAALLVVGMSADKDADGFARELAPLAARAIAVRAQHPRAMPPQQVADAFRKAGVDAAKADGLDEALTHALAVADKHDVTCLTGSLFVAAEGIVALMG